MKLSQLVEVRQSISRLTVKDLQEELESVRRTAGISLLELQGQYVNPCEDLLTAIANTEKNLVEIKEKTEAVETIVKNLIEVKEQPFMLAGSVIDGTSVVKSYDVESERLHRMEPMPLDIRYDLSNRIQINTSPRYAGLEIGPGDGQFTKYMVAADPLYLVDIYTEFLESAVSQFPEEYRRRVRRYQVGSHGVSATSLEKLPENQFGFVSAINVFDYLTFDLVVSYLKSCYEVLRPGGVMLFTYSNGEDPHFIRLAERGVKGYHPKTKLIQSCRDLGFDIVLEESRPSLAHWLEIKKPGELRTVKNTQALGKIINVTH